MWYTCINYDLWFMGSYSRNLIYITINVSNTHGGKKRNGVTCAGLCAWRSSLLLIASEWMDIVISIPSQAFFSWIRVGFWSVSNVLILLYFVWKKCTIICTIAYLFSYGIMITRALIYRFVLHWLLGLRYEFKICISIICPPCAGKQ